MVCVSYLVAQSFLLAKHDKKNDDLSGFYKIFWLKTFNCILIDVVATFLFPHKLQAFK